MGYVAEAEELATGSCSPEEEAATPYTSARGGGESLEGGWDSISRGAAVLPLW